MATNPSLTDDDAVPSGLSRRDVLARSAAGGLGLALSGSLGLLFSGPADAARHTVGYGPLVPDPAGILSLPKGFSYEIVAESGATTLETGEATPSDPDGTAAFPALRGRGSVLVNNHEISGSEPDPVPHVPGYTYDPGVKGGTTTIELETAPCTPAPRFATTAMRHSPACWVSMGSGTVASRSQSNGPAIETPSTTSDEVHAR